MERLLPSPSPTISGDDLAGIVEGLRRFVLDSASPERTDRLWPSDILAFAGNPISLGYGAAGIALFLHRTGGLPDYAFPWIEARLAETPLPPGLYTGAAGLAVVFAELGRSEMATRLLRKAAASDLLADDPGFFQGRAGIGWACLYADAHEPDTGLVSLARDAADALIAQATVSDDGLSWPPSQTGDDGEPVPCPLGLARGASGVALFLATLAEATCDDRYARAARLALDFELAQADRSGGRLRWGKEVGYSGTSPYWLHGTAGVGLALLRYAAATGDVDALEDAVLAARGVRALFAGYPGVFEGMSGIGHFLLDVHTATGDAEALHQAREFGRSILCYRIERDGDRVAFPGRGLSRISADYGSGGAGVGLFLSRLRTLAPRSFYDLP